MLQPCLASQLLLLVEVKRNSTELERREWPLIEGFRSAAVRVSAEEAGVRAQSKRSKEQLQQLKRRVPTLQLYERKALF